jgi:dTDP-4-amino-4,6-dideoxygalactose transaminase
MKPKIRIPWWQPQVEKGDYASVKRALDANFVNEGPLTREFEEKIARLVGGRNLFEFFRKHTAVASL